MNFLRTMQPYKGGRFKGKLSGEEFGIRCPYHVDTDPSLYVNLESGMFHCLGCEESGWIPDLVATLENTTYEEAVEIIESRGGDLHVGKRNRRLQGALRRSDRTVDESLFESFFPVQKQSAYMNYLLDRNITYKTASAFDLREGPLYDQKWGQRIIYPVRDGQGRLRSIKGRSIRPASGLRYRELEGSKSSAGLFYSSIPAKPAKYVYVTEGPFDAMAVFQVKFKPVVAMSATTLSGDQCLLLKRFGLHPIVMLDPIRPGTESKRRDVEQKIRNTLSGYFARYTVLSIKAESDLADLGAEDEIGLAKLLEKIKKGVENESKNKVKKGSDTIAKKGKRKSR